MLSRPAESSFHIQLGDVPTWLLAGLALGALIAANMLSARIINPLNQLVAAWRNLAVYRQSVGRLGEAFAIEEDRRTSALCR